MGGMTLGACASGIAGYGGTAGHCPPLCGESSPVPPVLTPQLTPPTPYLLSPEMHGGTGTLDVTTARVESRQPPAEHPFICWDAEAHRLRLHRSP